MIGMPAIARIVKTRSGRRLYIAGHRVHHGPGAATLAILTYRFRVPRILTAALVAWAATDWKDFPFRDCDNHA